VAEAHEADAGFLVLDPAHEVLGLLPRLLQPLQHLQHLLVGAAVQRTEQCVDAGGDRGEEVGLRGAHHAHRGRRAVLLVVGVQDQQQVQRLGRMGSTRRARPGVPKVIRRKFSVSDRELSG
jgi:hypothetical protein